jgi:hypothetical protein
MGEAGVALRCQLTDGDCLMLGLETRLGRIQLCSRPRRRVVSGDEIRYESPCGCAHIRSVVGLTVVWESELCSENPETHPDLPPDD